MQIIFQFPCSSWVSWNVLPWVMSVFFFLTVEQANGCNLQPLLSWESTRECLSVDSCTKMATGTAALHGGGLWFGRIGNWKMLCSDSKPHVFSKRWNLFTLLLLWKPHSYFIKCRSEAKDRNVDAVFQSKPSSHHFALWTCTIVAFDNILLCNFLHKWPAGSRCH